jgi:3-oxoacyl-[acyl-carrier protein] reductase
MRVENMKLKGKVALVTGGSRGIGRANAIRLAAEGALVAVHYGRNPGAASETVRTIEQAGAKAFPVKADFSSIAEVKQLFSALDLELTKRTGAARFDILVNNASIAELATIEETSEELFDRHFAINVKSVYFLTKGALPRLNDSGRIINISSSGTRFAEPGHSAYYMTKGAVNNLTLTLAQQLGKRGITVNSLAPGVTDTEINAAWLNDDAKRYLGGQTALGRVGAAEDMAGVAAFLASDDGRWVTGQYIEASGGLRL